MLKRIYYAIMFVSLLVLSVIVAVGSFGALYLGDETGTLPTQPSILNQTVTNFSIPTPSPSPTSTPFPTDIPSPTSPVPTPSPTPTDTSTPTPTPAPSSTPTPTDLPTQTPTPTPTPTSTPSPTPVPSSSSFSWASKNWVIVDGEWNITNNKMYGSGSFEALITADATARTDCAVTMHTIIDTGAESSIVVRYVDANNFYWMGVGCWGHQYSIGRVLNGAPTEIASYGLASNVQQGITYTLRAVATGNTLTLYVNETQVLQTTDSSLVTGAFGIRTYNSSIQALDIAET